MDLLIKPDQEARRVIFDLFGVQRFTNRIKLFRNLRNEYYQQRCAAIAMQIAEDAINNMLDSDQEGACSE